MKNFHCKNLFIFGMILVLFANSFAISTENQNVPYKYVYDIENSNGVMEIWGFGNCSTETGGTIEFLENGNYSSWGVEEMHYNLTFTTSANYVNKSIGNYSSTSVAFAFLLGFGYFQPSIKTHTNWTKNDASAIGVANTPTSELYSLNGTLDISSANGIRTYDYEQNETIGNQKVLLKYQESTGILQRWESFFLGYNLTANLNYTASILPAKALENTGFSIPGYSPLILIVQLTIVVPFIISRRKK